MPPAAALALVLILGACGGSGGDPEGDDVPTAADAASADGSIDRADGQGADEGAGGIGQTGDAAPASADASSPGGYVTAPGVEACSIDDVKARVDFDMRDYYVFASLVPDLSPASFETPEALIRGLRVAPDTFSSVSDAAAFEAQTEGRNVGFGFQIQEDEAGEPRFRLVLGGSPSADAGLERGDVLLAVDGEPVETLGRDGVVARLDGALEGEAVHFIVRRDGVPQPIDVDVTKAEYVIDTIAGTFAFTADDGTRVGYVPILQFSATTADALDGAFAFLVEQGVEALVLDLRYNPGGLIFAANRLAVHVAGQNVAGGTFVKYLFNETYAREANEDVPFERVESTLGLDRVVIVATGESASSAELAINGLAPYVDVEVVGSTTFGKAFGSAPLPYCDSVINAMLFITANAEEATVAGGIEPDCAVEDAWDRPLGDADDALTGAAYELLIDGTCPSDALADTGPASRGRTGVATPPIWDEAPRVPSMLDLR